MTEYYVPAGSGESEYVEKRSQFLGHVRCVESEEEAKAFIAEMKKKYYDARHNCSCYILRGGVERYADDGEPQGTAGLPMLEVFRREGVENVVCVVTRYFGGVLLGAGGLVRAYSHTAKIAVEKAGMITMGLCAEGEATCDYTLYGKLQPLLCREGAILTDTAFADSVTLRFRIPAERWDALCAAVVDASFGRCTPCRTGEAFAQIGG